MELIPITTNIAVFLAIQMFVLTLMVSFRRVSLGKAEGDVAKYPIHDGNDELLARRIGAFSNFIEYAPMCIIMLALLEISGASAALIWGLGASFAVGRVLHAIGMFINPHFPLPRIIGMFATYAVLLARISHRGARISRRDLILQWIF